MEIPIQADTTVQIKNIIFLIPDGCSSDLLSIGRWLQGGIPLALDQRICGLVRTYCADSPIGDSAPTGSTYACGHRSMAGYIGTFPDTTMDKHGKRYPTNKEEAFRPMFSFMEAARLQQKATGMVVSCYLPHATPASFLAHTPKRRDFPRITKQMLHNPCDIFLGGGSDFVEFPLKEANYNALSVLKQQGIDYTNSFAEVQQAAQKGKTKIWGLFSPQEMAYEIDRDSTKEPSLAEMSQIAIDMLSKNPQGFALMIEGSKIDWAAHNNDAPGAVFDFLAFDRAVNIAMQFAKKDGHTLVIVAPDHMTGGLQLGNHQSDRHYAHIPADELLGFLSRCKHSSEWSVQNIYLEKFAKNTEHAKDSSLVLKNYLREMIAKDQGIIDLKEEELDTLMYYFQKKGFTVATICAYTKIINQRGYLGWTTYGHTGGDVFLAMYHPQNRSLTGVVDNEEIAPYICQEAQLGNLDSLSALYYAPIEKVFEKYAIKIVDTSIKNIKLEKQEQKGAKKNAIAEPKYRETEAFYAEIVNGKKKLKIYPNVNYIELNGNKIYLSTPVIYNGYHFYLPVSVKTYIE